MNYLSTMSDITNEHAVCRYWFLTVAITLSLIGIIAGCICSCRRNRNKSEFLGLAGMVTITRSENDDFDTQPTPDIAQIITQDAVDSGKRASSANRSLPDIPRDRNGGVDQNGIASTPQDSIYEAAEVMGDPSELYATVHDKTRKCDTDMRKTRTNSQESSILQEDDSVYPYARVNPSKSPNDEHPYAQLQNIQKHEVKRQESFRDSNQISDINQASTSSNQQISIVAPPRTRRSSSHNSLLNAEVSSGDIQAANAITGGVQANQDLPYMTPPILMSLPRVPQSQHNVPPQQHFSGDSQDSKGYTSISVREPLANIIAQTKAAHQNRQTPHRALTDSHYATVSDDSDEMYAAIDEQEKIYTSGSETYAQIQPMANDQNRMIVSEQPVIHQIPLRVPNEESSILSAPQPPSVDSLRHVAHAHSRQASCSSATSSIANPGSPKPEKRQANSPLPPPPPPLPPAEEKSDVYMCIDKHSKSEDHQTQGHHMKLSSGKSLEDMYAKVMKKKRDSEDENYLGGTSNSSIGDLQNSVKKNMEISRVSWSSHDSIDIQKREADIARTTYITSDILNSELPLECSKVARIYELDRVTPDYIFEPQINTQRISNRSSDGNDPNYEMLRPFSRGDDKQTVSQLSTSMRNGIDVLPFYSVPLNLRQVSNASSEDPGYEKVRIHRRVDVDLDLDSEPNYESMPHESSEPNYASVYRSGYNDSDPNYESVNRNDPNYETVNRTEPNYESVNRTEPNYASVDNGDSSYAKINRSDPNYKLINRNDIDYDLVNRSDPNYESINRKNPNYESVNCSEPNYQTVDHNDPSYETVDRSYLNYEDVKYMSTTQNVNSKSPYEQVNTYKNDKNVDDGLMENTDTDDEQYVQV